MSVHATAFFIGLRLLRREVQKSLLACESRLWTPGQGQICIASVPCNLIQWTRYVGSDLRGTWGTCLGDRKRSLDEFKGGKSSIEINQASHPIGTSDDSN